MPPFLGSLNYWFSLIQLMRAKYLAFLAFIPLCTFVLDSVLITWKSMALILQINSSRTENKDLQGTRKSDELSQNDLGIQPRFWTEIQPIRYHTSPRSSVHVQIDIRGLLTNNTLQSE